MSYKNNGLSFLGFGHGRDAHVQGGGGREHGGVRVPNVQMFPGSSFLETKSFEMEIKVLCR